MSDLLILAAVFVPALGLYAAIMWLTGDGGPCDVNDWWDEDQRP